MSEKRFILSVNEDAPNTLDIIDTVADKTYNFVNDVVSMNQAKQLVVLLNEQQSDLNYLARFIGEFKVEEFKLKLRNLRILEEENKQMKKQLEQIPKSIREVWLE